MGVQVWQDNPVNTQATCMWTTTNRVEGSWTSANGTAPKFLAPFATGRQCWLAGLWGISGSWNSSSRFARVIKVNAVDADHPQVGWYIEANLPTASDGSKPHVFGRCVTFPAGTIFQAEELVDATDGVTKTESLTSGTGVKACAMTRIGGALNVNSWTNGALLNFPATIDGNWSVTVTAGKKARFVCVR